MVGMKIGLTFNSNKGFVILSIRKARSRNRDYMNIFLFLISFSFPQTIFLLLKTVSSSKSHLLTFATREENRFI